MATRVLLAQTRVCCEPTLVTNPIPKRSLVSISVLNCISLQHQHSFIPNKIYLQSKIENRSRNRNNVVFSAFDSNNSNESVPSDDSIQEKSTPEKSTPEKSTPEKSTNKVMELHFGKNGFDFLNLIQIWKSAAPTVKWPLAIFTPWMCFVTAIFGPAVTLDLLPLWILGPLLLISLIHVALRICATCQFLTLKSILLGKAAMASSSSFVDYAKSESFEKDVQSNMEDLIRKSLKVIRMIYRNVLDLKNEWVEYVSSGRFANELVGSVISFVRKLLVGLIDRLVRVLEDWLDWYGPTSRRLGKLVRTFF